VTFTFRPAKRESVGLLIGLAGASGSGKTMSALRIATGLAGDKPFALIDTENGRALHYADQFRFDHGELRAPFRPAAYAEAIAAADQAGYPVIVVDSASHEHAGDGGLLDWQEEELQRMAGDDYQKRERVKMAAWIQPKLAHKQFVSRLLQVRAHLILCFRAEEKIEIAKEGGKTVVRPKASAVGLDGWIPVSEKNLPYELTLSLLLTADAPGLPKPIKLQEQHRPMVPLDQPLSEETGRLLGEWAAGSSSASSSEEAKEEVDALVQRLLELATRAGKLEATSKAIEEKPRDAAWVRRQIKRLEESLAGEGVGDSAVTGSAPRSGSDPVRSPANDGEQTKFPIPAGARMEDQG